MKHELTTMQGIALAVAAGVCIWSSLLVWPAIEIARGASLTEVVGYLLDELVVMVFVGLAVDGGKTLYERIKGGE